VLDAYIGNVRSERHLLAAHVQRAESAFHPISVCLLSNQRLPVKTLPFSNWTALLNWTGLGRYVEQQS